MSGIYIKGLEMPGVFCGADIVLYEGINGSAVPRKYKISANRVVSVPPHGRLIDADALLDEGADLCLCEYDCENTWGFSYDMINDAPTIIQASEDGEK